MPSAFPIPPTLRDARQLLLVVAGGWSSRDARLQRLERRGGAAPWKVIGQPVAVSLGRSGLAPASGQAAACAPDVPPKREGDGRSPAGIFPITALFGDAGPDSDLARSARLPWLHGTRDLKCVDDLASRYYNQIVDSTRVDRVDWVSCEDMWRADGRYAVGAVVGHNCAPAVPGAGSCIFLHVWAAPGVPTAGCTAMSLADMTEVAGWLDGAAAPVLVQLPWAGYERWREAWGLPAFAAHD
jgi:L,D-peptidoglycan transpeptidase YkuD (ErfK/YbiS/YcfS/YnhG family)